MADKPITPMIINYGSINIDHVYRVPHFVRPGETLNSQSLSTGLGGKGANQSVAIARAGGNVLHIGQICQRDEWVLAQLQASGVDVSAIQKVDQPSGHAIIQLDSEAENAIVLHGGANQTNDHRYVRSVLEGHRQAAYLLIQNECNGLQVVIETALSMGVKVALNPAPMHAQILDLPLNQLDTLILNQTEAELLTGETDLNGIERACLLKMPNTRVVLTLGKRGSVLLNKDRRIEQPALPVKAKDTTGAGDTFVGYLLATLAHGGREESALKLATAAAALTVTKPGAIAAIHTKPEVQSFLDAQTNH